MQSAEGNFSLGVWASVFGVCRAACRPAAIREETHARQAIAANLLPADAVKTDAEAFHLWLSLSEPWTRGEFVERLRSSSVGVVASDAFALGHAPQAVRLGLGAAA